VAYQLKFCLLFEDSSNFLVVLPSSEEVQDVSEVVILNSLDIGSADDSRPQVQISTLLRVVGERQVNFAEDVRPVKCGQQLKILLLLPPLLKVLVETEERSRL